LLLAADKRCRKVRTTLSPDFIRGFVFYKWIQPSSVYKYFQENVLDRENLCSFAHIFELAASQTALCAKSRMVEN